MTEKITTASRGWAPKIKAVGLDKSLFDDVYHSVLVSTWKQFFAAIVAVFLAANTIFAGLYMIVPGSIANARDGSFVDAFFFSVETMATIGYGEMSPAGPWAHVLMTAEALFGMLLTAVMTGVTFAKFARPTARVLFAKKIVITKRDGVPYLMLRMGNYRGNTILEATLRVMLLVETVTAEGHTMRRPMEIVLERNNTAMFSMTWTAMHRIDENSPFYAPDALEKLRAQKAEIFLTLNGLDDTLAATVHARYGYRLEDIVENATFVDVLSIEPDGTRVIDYTNFHEVKPL